MAVNIKKKKQKKTTTTTTSKNKTKLSTSKWTSSYRPLNSVKKKKKKVGGPFFPNVAVA